MRYLTIYRSAAGEEGGTPTPERMAEMGRMVEEWMAKGVLVTTEPLGVRATGGMLAFEDGDFQLSDDPRRASGYAIINADSREQLVGYLQEFLEVAGPGTVEFRQILDF